MKDSRAPERTFGSFEHKFSSFFTFLLIILFLLYPDRIRIIKEAKGGLPLLNLFMMRPCGVVSKKAMGQCMRQSRVLLWSALAPARVDR
jgi:hypothetical protein